MYLYLCLCFSKHGYLIITNSNFQTLKSLLGKINSLYDLTEEEIAIVEKS